MFTTATSHKDHRLGWLRPMVLPALLALVLLVAGGVFLDHQNLVLSRERVRGDVMAEMSVIRANLEGNITSNIQLVRGLVAVIGTEPNLDQERFASLSANLFEGGGQLRSVAAAPDLIVSLVYPMEGNERAMGLDYRHVPDQRDAVFRARDTGKLVLAGPVHLRQGGTGFLGRFPVFVDSDGGRKFWGIVTAVVDVGRLFADSGVFAPASTIDISITGTDATGEHGTRFYGNDLSDLSPVTADVVLPSGSWQISAVPKGGWEAVETSFWLLRGLIAIAGALIVLPLVLTARLLRERNLHFRELTNRKSELVRLSRRLGLALDASKVGVWEMDFATRELVWDDRMNELYGLPADGKPRHYVHWRNALHPEDAAAAERDFATLSTTGGYESQFRTLQADGTVTYVRAIGATYRDDDGKDKIVGVNWDVTEDVLRNDELRNAKKLTEARNRDLEAARVRIEHNALHDSLTGLPNRRFVDEVLRSRANERASNAGQIALLHMDLDRFKQINDTLGHAAGDAMLIHASKVLRDNCAPGDVVARIGGDEFVVLTSCGEGEAELIDLADRIIQQMRLPVTFEGHECRFGVSIGIAAAPSDEIDLKRLLINADIALYRAKAMGRNRFEFFSQALQAEVVNTKRIADEILNGLERNEFVAWFQPQFDARTHEIVGLEALARWNHPVNGITLPGAFMQIAEDLNVMATLDRLILDQTLRALETLDAKGLTVPRASVNVSLRRLHDSGLIEDLRDMAIAPGRISFELVESIYLDENDAVVGWNIDQLKELGIDVEIDDFGTGYASIVSLQKLRPARLKIDRQLVHPILDDPAQRQLLASIVDIGKSMGIEVVAEGVETLEHAAILRDLGCDILQGYAFSRPLSLADLERLLQTKSWLRAS